MNQNLDTLFTATLAFCALVGGTVAIGSAMFESGRTDIQSTRTAQQPRQDLAAQAASATQLVAVQGIEASRSTLH